MIRFIPLFWLAGCPWVGTADFVEIRDLDGDGGIAERFGGSDCVDDDPTIADCDADGDGVLSDQVGGDDCDDLDATVYPNAPEICDSLDNDCDGQIDNDDPDAIGRTPFYVDADGDGEGDPQNPVACQTYTDPTDPTTGVHSPDDDDCDDLDPDVNSRADERCDGFDNDCDGIVDDVGIWYLDADADGFGAPGVQVSGPCVLPAGELLAATADDCNDLDPDVHPDAPEVPYDGVDDNCSDDADDWDADLDGHVPDAHWPDAAAQNLQRSTPWDIVRGDCDDTVSAVHPDADEICDALDNDCDGQVDTDDDDLVDPSEMRFLDLDGDGAGGTPILLCTIAIDPAIHLENGTDCYDTLGDADFLGIEPAEVGPGADETCDQIDNDCDTRTDWSDVAFAGASPHFLDLDGDGFGVDPFFACGPDNDAHLVAIDGDCDDAEPTAFPGAEEICGDLLRQDCLQASLWDCDADGQEGDYFGSGSGEDCDDDNAEIYVTSAPLFEICDGVDNDCDGLVDSHDLDNLDETEQTVWYVDNDGDGYGDDSIPGEAQCDAPATPASRFGGDCNDDDPLLSPATRWYRDQDGDGFGDLDHPNTPSCEPPTVGHWVLDATDCNDLDASFHPDVSWVPDQDGDFLGSATGAVLACLPPANHVRESNGIDCDDHDSTIGRGGAWYLDGDGDGSGDDTTAQQACLPPTAQHVRTGGDCDDADPTRDPQRPETCNAIDDDCDGAVDDDDDNLIGSGPLAYRDFDGDGFGSSQSKRFCFEIASGWTDATGDCDDEAPLVHPAAVEICGNGIDDDCDGVEQIPSWYLDRDGDGFGSGVAAPPACEPPDLVDAWVTTGTDCNDLNANSFPGAVESDSCDGEDQDCDGTAEPLITWYLDRDLDGLGDDTTAELACTPPLEPGADAVVLGGDCDDTDPTNTIGRIWYRDGDGDGLGNGAASTLACPQYELGVELSVWLVDDQNGNGLFDVGDEQLSVDAGDCNDARADIGLATNWFVDADGDGFGSDLAALVTQCPDTNGNAPDGLTIFGGDCADVPETLQVQPPVLDPADVNPLAGEGLTGALDPTLFDHEDNNCDTLVDQLATGIVWFSDADGDGFGGAYLGPFQPGAVTNNADCDDADPGVLNGRLLFIDADGDSFGAGSPIFTGGCGALPPHRATAGGDCDDSLPAINPSADEVCDSTDNDCDGLTDEGAPVMWEDFDQDGAGTGPERPFCQLTNPVPPVGLEDCDDQDARVAPLFEDTCDGLDNDCDGDIDEHATQAWPDADGDGHTVNLGVIQFCGDHPPPFYTIHMGLDDCDDTDPEVHNGQLELCSTHFDDNCDGVTHVGQRFQDLDGDGVGDHEGHGLCGEAPYVDTGGDCDDNDPHRRPGLPDVCDGVDNDCDSDLDEDAAPDDFVTYFRDFDHDTFGSDALPAVVCSSLPQPLNTVAISGDCDDGDPQVHPGQVERCDGVDEDCDGLAEADVDGDGWFVCPGEDAHDCDDDEARMNPGNAIEYCDGLDNDCDGAHIDGYVDVSNPFTGTVVPDTQYSHAVTAMNGESLYLDVFLSSCEPVTGTWTWPAGGFTTRDLYPLDDLDPELLTVCSQTEVEGLLYLPDADNDGRVTFTGRLDELGHDCAGTPPPLGAAYYPVDGLDCAPSDPNRWLTIGPTDTHYVDQDGDGLRSLLPAPEGSCVGNIDSFSGPDCDDSTFGSITHASDLWITHSNHLNDALNACVTGTLVLDVEHGTWSNEADYLSPPHSTLEIQGVGQHTCDIDHQDTCISGDLTVQGDLTVTGVPLDMLVIVTGEGALTLQDLISVDPVVTTPIGDPTVDIRNCLIQGDGEPGIAVVGGEVRVTDSILDGRGAASQISISGGRLNVSDSEFIGTQTSAVGVSYSEPTDDPSITLDRITFGTQLLALDVQGPVDVVAQDLDFLNLYPLTVNHPEATVACRRCSIEAAPAIVPVVVDQGHLQLIDTEFRVHPMDDVNSLIEVDINGTLVIDGLEVFPTPRSVVLNQGVFLGSDLTLFNLGLETPILTNGGTTVVDGLSAPNVIGTNAHLFQVDDAGWLEASNVESLGGTLAGIVHAADSGTAIVTDALVDTSTIEVPGEFFAVFEAVDDGRIEARNIEHRGDPGHAQYLVRMEDNSEVVLEDVVSRDILGTLQGFHGTDNGLLSIQDAELHIDTPNDNFEMFANHANAPGQTLLNRVRVFHTGNSRAYISRTNGNGVNDFYFQAHRSLFYSDRSLRLYAGTLVDVTDSSIRMDFGGTPTDTNAPLVGQGTGELRIIGSLLDFTDGTTGCKAFDSGGTISVSDTWVRDLGHLQSCASGVHTSGLTAGPDIAWDPLTGVPLNGSVFNNFGELRQ